jgi:glycosyltransferase involved in cell wall biosynthesis
MKIILDGSDAVVGVSAIRRYTINLIRELISGYPDDRVTVFLTYFRGASQVMDELVGSGKNVSRIRYALPRRLSLPLWELLGVPRVDWFTGPADVFHALGDDGPPVKGAVYILTLHGLVYMTRPDLIDPVYVQKKRSWLQRMSGRADYFIAVSEHTKIEFLSCFPEIDPRRVRVIPLGIGSEFRVLERRTVQEKLKAEFQINRPYILYVGGLGTHKNIQGILRGFSFVVQRYPDLDLVLAGGPGRGYAEIQALASEERLRDRVKVIGYVAQETDRLPLLYNGAECFVFPSFSEGWTSPPLEAMACGTPVLTSNVSSLPETVGDAALTVDPSCPEAIGHAMDRLLIDSALRADLQRKGLKHSSRFTWKRCAESTHALYRDAATAHGI